jgi:hypothetical protein
LSILGRWLLFRSTFPGWTPLDNMTAQMEWSPDFCLSCDRQISDGAYCSQACRLADLEKAGTAEQASTARLSSSASSSSSSTSSNAGFHLPPAVNFAAFKAPSTSRGFDLAPASPQYYTAANGSYYTSPAANTVAVSSRPQQRNLSPSSSRSSLSSSSASQSASGISVQAANQLSGYVRSFDQVRDIRRRFNTY